MSYKLILLAATALLTSSCSVFHPTGDTIAKAAATPAGAAIIAQASNAVVNLGLNAGATRIETGNPYLHSIAVGLRANEGQIVTPGDVQRIVHDYGDPKNTSKMKVLAADLWSLIKGASGRIALSAATELAAQGLQQGAATK